MLFRRMIDVFVCRGSMADVEPPWREASGVAVAGVSCRGIYPLGVRLPVDWFRPEGVDERSIEGKADG